MKKALSVAVSVSLVLLPLVAFAVPVENIPEGPQSIEEFLNILEKIANWIFAILLAVALIFIVYAAFKFVTAAGNPANVEQARQMLLFAIVGIVVAVAARGIVAVAKSIITG